MRNKLIAVLFFLAACHTDQKDSSNYKVLAYFDSAGTMRGILPVKILLKDGNTKYDDLRNEKDGIYRRGEGYQFRGWIDGWAYYDEMDTIYKRPLYLKDKDGNLVDTSSYLKYYALRDSNIREIKSLIANNIPSKSRLIFNGNKMKVEKKSSHHNNKWKHWGAIFSGLPNLGDGSTGYTPSLMVGKDVNGDIVIDSGFSGFVIASDSSDMILEFGKKEIDTNSSKIFLGIVKDSLGDVKLFIDSTGIITTTRVKKSAKRENFVIR